jgi:hypothetical protein
MSSQEFCWWWERNRLVVIGTGTQCCFPTYKSSSLKEDSFELGHFTVWKETNKRSIEIRWDERFSFKRFDGTTMFLARRRKQLCSLFNALPSAGSAFILLMKETKKTDEFSFCASSFRLQVRTENDFVRSKWKNCFFTMIQSVHFLTRRAANQFSSSNNWIDLSFSVLLSISIRRPWIPIAEKNE